MAHEQTLVLASRDEKVIEAARAGLGDTGDYRLVICESLREAEKRLNEVNVHLLFCDADLIVDPNANLILTARVTHPRTARVLIASASDAARCAEIARISAAYLYLLKPVEAGQFALLAKRSLELNELSFRHRLLTRELRISMDDDIFAHSQGTSFNGGFSQFERMVYVSPKMASLVDMARKAAATDMTLLIQGETGSGKELLARAMHHNSARANALMHVQSCGGISDEALQSELFGHAGSSFPKAVPEKLGLLRAADGGTVFLDEISEISLGMQLSLLRFLQDGEVRPLGSDQKFHVDVRIIGASNRSLEDMVAKGLFRRDLYYRMKGAELRVPPLRDRLEDIAVLTDFFIEKYAGVIGRRVMGVTRDALAKMEAYDFPGNVRELEAEVQRMVSIADQGGYVSARHLSDVFAMVQVAPDQSGQMMHEGADLKDMVSALERRVIERTLRRYRWNQSRVADELGLSRVGLANKIKRFGLRENQWLQSSSS